MNGGIVCTSVCPAIVLALDRIAGLNDFITWGNVSIAINIGNNINGHSGIKILRDLIPWTRDPRIKIPKDGLKDNHGIMIK